jgi:hypothetical protein
MVWVFSKAKIGPIGARVAKADIIKNEPKQLKIDPKEPVVHREKSNTA